MLRLPLLATAVILAAVLLYQGAALLGAQRKLAPLGALPEAHGSYRITLDFAPERFHQLFLQDRGRLVGVHDNVVDMMDVTPTQLRTIARRYWVASIARWNPP